MLTALSRGAGGGAGFRPAGRFVGGAGGVGFVRAVGIARDDSLATMPFVGAEANEGAAGGAGGGVGFATSGVRYADGTQPCAEPSSFLVSHQPVAWGQQNAKDTVKDESLTIWLLPYDLDDLVFGHMKLNFTLTRKVVKCFVSVFLYCGWGHCWRRRRRRCTCDG